MSKQSRRRFDDHDYQPPVPVRAPRLIDDDADADSSQPTRSTYVDALKGPAPLPAWMITSANAVDDDLGVMKSGKEADVSLLRRTDETRSCLMAVKRYRSAQHRLFHRDTGYLEGRQVRRTRETRAMATRTEFGRELISYQWAAAEFEVLSRLWSLGAAVPYPAQLIGTELMMEFIGTTDGVAAPRLAQIRPTVAAAENLFVQLRRILGTLIEAGYAHGDLSAYNVLVHEQRVVLIDLPQAVDLVANPQGFAFLRRDCVNICSWFQAHGVDASSIALESELIEVYGNSGIDGLWSEQD